MNVHPGSRESSRASECESACPVFADELRPLVNLPPLIALVLRLLLLDH